MARGLLVAFAASLLLYAGPRFWGDAIRLLPMAGDLHFHRLIVPVQLTALGLAGVALAAALELAARLRAAGAVGVALGGGAAAGSAVARAASMSELRRSWQEETQRPRGTTRAGSIASSRSSRARRRRAATREGERTGESIMRPGTCPYTRG